MSTVQLPAATAQPTSTITLQTLAGVLYFLDVFGNFYGAPELIRSSLGLALPCLVGTEGTQQYQRFVTLPDGRKLVFPGGQNRRETLQTVAYALGHGLHAEPLPTFTPETRALLLGLKKGDVIEVTGNVYAFLDTCKVFAKPTTPRERGTIQVTLAGDYKTDYPFNRCRSQYFDSIGLNVSLPQSGYLHTLHVGAYTADAEHWERNYGYFTFERVVSRAAQA